MKKKENDIRIRSLSLTSVKRNLLDLIFLIVFLYGSSTLSADDYRQGRVHLGQRNYTAAMQSFQSALKSDPSNGNSWFYIAYIQERQGNKPAAIESYKRAVGSRMKPDLKEQAYWKIVLYLRHIEDWDSLSVYAGRFLQFKSHSRVAELKALADSRRDPRKVEVARLTGSARQELKSGDFTNAARLYERAVSIMPEDDVLRWNFISIAVKADRHDIALKHLNVLKRKHPNAWKYQYKSGVSEYNLGFYSDALESFDRAEEINKKPDRSFKRYISIGRGLTLLELDDVEGAYRELKEANQIKSSDAVIAGLARATVYLNRPDAGKYVNEAKKSASEKPDTHLASGLYSVQNNTKAAVEHLKKYLNHSESNQNSPVYREVQLILADQQKAPFNEIGQFQLLNNCPESDLELKNTRYLYSKSHPESKFLKTLSNNPVEACYIALSKTLESDTEYRDLKIDTAPEETTTAFFAGYYFYKSGQRLRALQLLEKSFKYKPYLERARTIPLLMESMETDSELAALLEKKAQKPLNPSDDKPSEQTVLTDSVESEAKPDQKEESNSTEASIQE